jgi:competence protein ComEC
MIPTYTFFAVDKGNMTLIQFPNGVSMVVDCRRSETRPSPLEYLEQKGLRSLTFLVITHPHRDHLSGIQEMCEALKPKYLWHNGRYFKPDPVYDDWAYYEKLRNGKLSYCEPVRVRAGQTATIGNAKLVVSAPATPNLEGTTDDENNNGIILSVTAGNSKVVLTGDTQQEQWDMVDLRLLSNPSIFLASHHGRENGFSEEVMETLKPQHIVISDGEPADTDATEEYERFAPVTTTRENSVVVRPQD